jgi:phosphoribosylamine--glycine ligase
MLAVIDKKLHTLKIGIKKSAALTVVLAAPGYPNQTVLGSQIFGLESANGLVFHGGTRREGNRIMTSSGRVLSVTAEGVTVKDAATNAYKLIEGITFDKMHYRRDIGAKAF